MAPPAATVTVLHLPSTSFGSNFKEADFRECALKHRVSLPVAVLILAVPGLCIGLSVPACLIAAFAGSIEVLIFGRIVGGFSAGMAYPTTLALIAALWNEHPALAARG